jgi:micrococcal nuclease
LLLGALLLSAFLVQPSFSESVPLSGKVIRVYDGDTIEVENVGKVRLLGIDTPEWQGSDRDRYYLRKGISSTTLRHISTEAREFVATNTYGQLVTLTFDGNEHDRHGRLLAYVSLDDGRMLNRLLLEAGLACVYRRFNFSLKSDFIKAEKLARGLSRGIWVDQKERRP